MAIKTNAKARKIAKIQTDFEEAVSPSPKNEAAPSDKPHRRTLSEIDPDTLVPSPSTTVNLECSGRTEGAFKIGTMINLIGDSHAGKTLFALSIFPECSLFERFDNYEFIYDDVEAANGFDIPYLFGDTVGERIYCLETEPDDDGMKRSRTIEDLNDNLARLYSLSRQCIYVVDSFDALTSEAAIEKDQDNRTKREKGNNTKGSYGDGKAKKSSEMFSQRIQEIAEMGSFLIIISQTRDNIGFGAQFTPKVRSGGRALKFYAYHEIWLACQKKEKKGKRTVETNVQAKVTKNKLNGRHGEAYFPILFDYGVDNIKSCINFLTDEGDWTDNKGRINSQGFVPKTKDSKKRDVHRTMAGTIKYIEDNNLEDELFGLVQEAYDKVIEGLRPNRKRRY